MRFNGYSSCGEPVRLKVILSIAAFGRWSEHSAPRLIRPVTERVYWLSFKFAEAFLGASIPRSAQIGEGLRAWHLGGIHIHPAVVIGANCILRQGVTLGNRRGLDDAPTLGDNVDVGAYAQILGKVTVGEGAKIGAGAIVLIDVPPGATAVGNPARVCNSV